MWGYLSEFWDSVTGVFVDAGQYTADFFYSIGNAVAGALGGAFDWLFHFFWDVFLFIGWLVEGFTELFTFITVPASYFFQFLKAFWMNLLKPTIEVTGLTEMTQYASSTADIFQSIPYWDAISIVIATALIIGGSIGVLYLFLKIR